MTADERTAFKDLLFWAEAYQRFTRSLRTKPPTPSLDEAVLRGRFLLEVGENDA